MNQANRIDFTVDSHEADWRFDHLVASRIPGCSRTHAARLIRRGQLQIENDIRKPGYRVSAGQRIFGHFSGSDQTPAFKAEPIPLDIIHTDDDCIVINKPAQLVVHPAPGHYHGTLAHGLLYSFPELKDAGPSIDRPGIVHRLDQDTSGILVVARNASAYQNLIIQFKERRIQKSYVAFVYGEPKALSGRITLPIARHPVNRKKMAVMENEGPGRAAETHWKVIQRSGGISLVEFDIKTGRTHQIRVHSTAMGHPVVGDEVYGFRNPSRTFGLAGEIASIVRMVPRQMLHACKLGFHHPKTGRKMEFHAPMPTDMSNFNHALEKIGSSERYA